MRSALLAAALLVACKDTNPAPDVPDARPRGDAPAPDAPIDAPLSCFDPAGTPANCFQQDVCEPTQLTDFLNSCTGAQCIAFDNVARLPRYNNGNLPALP
ncbi:MAG: hypothetical protein SFX73_23470 [Kofleriaceae bacterium]|nr:hypothetical protein [Kofleriaceae bacterium]